MTAMRQNIGILWLLLALAGCDGPRSGKPVTISIIGDPAQAERLQANADEQTGRVIRGAVAQGLVAFDGSGQIEPALAERWIIINGGLNYIFRISQANWPDGSSVSSTQVVQILKRNIAARSRDGTAPILRNIAAIVPMTPTVVELRLSAPMPGLLQLLAQPEMAIVANGRGTGPYRFHSKRDGVTRLRRIPIPDEEGELPEIAAQEPFDMRLRGEAASSAIVRFVNGGSDLVLGGKFQDLPYVSATDPGTGRFRVDPSPGLFGLRFLNSTGPLGDARVRTALSIAIDREKLVAAIRGESWEPAISVLPKRLDSSSAPAALEVLQRRQNERNAEAKAVLSGEKIKLKVLLPSGPGARLLFAALARDWHNVGVEAQLVKRGTPADLVLIDEVAPVDSALWYLGRLGCQQNLPCSSEAQSTLDLAAKAANAADRGDAIAKSDAMQAAAHYYIPLALPLRWSLVDPDVTGWRNNGFAVHPLPHLRPGPRP